MSHPRARCPRKAVVTEDGTFYPRCWVHLSQDHREAILQRIEYLAIVLRCAGALHTKRRIRLCAAAARLRATVLGVPVKEREE